MAQVLEVQLPGGFTRIVGEPCFDTTRVGQIGRWDINQNDPFAVWKITVSYVRESADEDASRRFDGIYNFFLVTGASLAFEVDDPIDNTAEAIGGEGHVEQINGVYRLTKHYKFGALTYVHPITRPKTDVVLSGSAAGGLLDHSTGIVSGINAPGRWSGGFCRPMVFQNQGLRYEADPSGIVRALDVPLEENLEI